MTKLILVFTPRSKTCRGILAIALCSFFLFVPYSSTAAPSSDPEDQWEKMPARFQKPLRDAAETISKSLEVTPRTIYHRTDAKSGFPGLPSQPYVTSSGVSWFLPGVDKDGRELTPSKGKRSPAYGDSTFQLSLLNVYGLAAEEVLEKMLEGRKLAEKRRELDIKGHRLLHDFLASDLPEAKKRLHDPLMAQREAMIAANRKKNESIKKSMDALRKQRDEWIASCRERKRAMTLSHRAAKSAFARSLPSYKRRGGYTFEDREKLRKFENPQRQERAALDKECGDKAHKLHQKRAVMGLSMGSVSSEARGLKKQAREAYAKEAKALAAKADSEREAMEPDYQRVVQDQRDRYRREQADALVREEEQVRGRFDSDAKCMLGAALAVLEDYQTESASRGARDERAGVGEHLLTRLTSKCNPQTRAKMRARSKKQEGSAKSGGERVQNPLADKTQKALEELLATVRGQEDPDLKPSVAQFERELAFFAEQTGQRLQNIEAAKEKLEKQKAKDPPRGYRKRKSARNFPYPYERSTRKFDVSGGQGVIFESRSAVHGRLRGRVTVTAYWPCGPYVARVALQLQKPVTKPERKGINFGPKGLNRFEAAALDGKHEWVPFLKDRLEQVESARNAALEALKASGLCEQDGYWAWKKEFENLLETNKNTLAWTIADLEMFSGAIDAKYREWMYSLALEMRSFCLPDKEEQKAWDDLSWFTKFKKGVTERAIGGRKVVDSPGTDLGGTTYREVDNYLGAPRESLSDEALAALRAMRRRLRTEINGFRTIQDQEINKAIASMTRLLESTRAQLKKSGDRRPHLEGAVQYWEDKVRALPVQLYITAQRPEGVRRELEKLGLNQENATEDLRLSWSALLDQLDGDVRARQQPVAGICDPSTRPYGLSAADRLRARALYKARRALELNPGNLFAAEVTRNLDSYFIDLIGKKQARARQLASDAFLEYLRQRGYDPANPSTWSETAQELGYTAWATGLLGNILFHGKPLRMSDRATKVALEVAENHVSLLAIRSLRRNSMPFAEIRNITGKKLKQHMRLRFVNGRPLPQAKADRIAGGIRKLLGDARLADLQALASDDETEKRFVAAFAKEHYPGTTDVNTWPEWVLDLSSARNVGLLFGPSAVVRVSGRGWALTRWGKHYKVWTKATGVAGVAVQDATALSVREAVLGTPSWVLSSPRLQPLVSRLSGGRLERAYKSASTALTDLIIRDQIAYHNMGKLRKGLQYGGALVGATMVYGGAFQIAEDQNLPWLRTMVEVLAILSAEEVLVDVFKRNGIPTLLLKGNLNKAERFLQMERGRLLSYRKRLDAVRPLRDTAQISGPDIDLSGPHVPGVDGYKDFLYAEKRAKELSKKSRRSPVEEQDYKDALQDMERFIDRLDDGIKDMDGKITRARAGMGEHDNPVHPDLGEPKSPKKPDDVPNPEKLEPDIGYWDGKDYALTGAPFKQGDELLKKGELEAAEQAYRHANAAPGPRTVDQTVYIERRLSLVERVKRAWRKIVKRRKPGPSPAQAPIDIEKVLKRLGPDGDLVIDLSRLSLPKKDQSINPVLFLKNKHTGKPEYAFKILRRDAGNPDELLNDAFMSALLADDILKKTGMRTPAAKVAEVEVPEFQYANDAGHVFTYGGRLEQGLLTRYVPGVNVNKLPIEEVLALKEAYARHGVLRAWLGDYDRHLGNMRLGDDGYPYLLDVGLADFNNFSGTTTEQTLRFLVNFRDRNPSPAGRWVRAMDDRTHIDTMKPVIAAIQELSSPQHEAKLLALVQEHFKDPAKVRNVFHQLKARSSMLEKVFKERFKNVAEKTEEEMQEWFVGLLSGRLGPL